jgi:site-specific DNA-methyltransferase (cytosine-N4-specific)
MAVLVSTPSVRDDRTPYTIGASADGRGHKGIHLRSRHHAALVLCGDAYDLAAQLQPSSIDCVITSPPYWGQRTYHRDHNWGIRNEWARATRNPADVPPYDWYRSHGGVLGLEPLPEWYISHLVEIFDRIRPAMKPTASLWVNLGDTYFARWSSIRPKGRQGLGDQTRVRRRTPMGGYRQEKQLLLIPARFAIAMQEHRWILRNDVIWYKPNIPPRPERDRLRLAHEHFFHFVLRPTRGRARYYYDLTAVEPGARDVVIVNAAPGQDGHSATFPEDLVRPRVLSTCPPGGVVLDPFCGTGRALKMAIDSGRKAIGFDVVPEYVVAARRLLQAGPQK